MSNGDSFELLLNQLLKDVRVISENLELIGLFYVGKFTLKSLWCVSKAIYSFVLPRLVSNDGWIKSHGKWAIVNGCTSQNGLGFAVELAKKKFHLILVDSNKILLTKLADFLAEEHKIKTVCFEPSSISRLIYDLDVLKEVGLLINCPYPHHSERTYFHSVDQNSLNEQILLNVNIPIALSRSVLPSMLSRNKGLILFVTSTSAQLPTPYSAVLESSSPFLEKFAESLQFEYGRNKNICIQCLRMDNVGEGFGDENSILDEKYLKNKRNFSGTARALKYLGWSKFATVEWTTALKIYTIKSFLPGFIFNPFYISILRRSFQ